MGNEWFLPNRIFSYEAPPAPKTIKRWRPIIAKFMWKGVDWKTVLSDSEPYLSQQEQSNVLYLVYEHMQSAEWQKDPKDYVTKWKEARRNVSDGTWFYLEDEAMALMEKMSDACNTDTIPAH